MGRRAVLLLPWIACALAAALAAAWWWSSRRDGPSTRVSLGVAELLSGGTTEGYLRALEPREFAFPEDHGAHDGFRTEWWYFTGNLADGAGRRFGYQLTFFRSALAPAGAPRAASFAADHAWMAHFTLTDAQRGRFHSFERLAREAADIAGCERAPVRVWLRDWSCEFSSSGLPLRLRARADGVAIDLSLDSAKPPVLQGDRGRSRKNAEPGNASYYYSLTRLASAGTVERGGERFAVRGESWMDREWMTSALGEDQIGWDWLALQLDDGSELMFYRLRRKDGAFDTFSGGSFVDANGRVESLAANQVELVSSGAWRSPRSGATYPDHWRLRVPSLALELELDPLLADQELDVSFRYWEGAVEGGGTRAGREVGARGYVELVGYTEEKPSPTGARAR